MGGWGGKCRGEFFGKDGKMEGREGKGGGIGVREDYGGVVVSGG